MIPTQSEFDLLYSDYQQLDTPERFGQFIYNRTGFELENSYNETDTQKVWHMLRRAVIINQSFPADNWIKCTDKMPDCDELRSKPYKAIFWIAVQRDKQPPFITLGVRRYRHGVWQWAQGHMERDSQLIFADDTVTHYIHVEAPEAPK